MTIKNDLTTAAAIRNFAMMYAQANQGSPLAAQCEEITAELARAMRVLRAFEAHETKYKNHRCQYCDERWDECPCSCNEPNWVDVYSLRHAADNEPKGSV